MKKTTKMQIFISILSLLPLILILATYSILPSKVPSHWDLDGTITYADKNILFIIAFVTILIAVLFPLLAKIDPKKRNYQKFLPSYQAFQAFMMLFMLAVTAIIVIEAIRPNTVNIPMIVLIMIGLLFAFLGNMMPRFRSNWFCGIRTPWTISSEQNWTKTHRLGGRMFFVSGILILLSAFIPNNNIRFGLVAFFALISAIVPCVFSYILYTKEHKS